MKRVAEMCRSSVLAGTSAISAIPAMASRAVVARVAVVAGICAFALLPASPATAAASAGADVGENSPAASGANGEGIPWGDDLRDALERSKETGEPIMLDFWAVWCAPCHHLEETVYADTDVIAAAADFVPVKIDHDAQTVVVERYRVEGIPQLIFLDHEGRLMSRTRGTIEKERVLELMTAVSDGYETYLTDIEADEDSAALRRLGRFYLAIGNSVEAVESFDDAVREMKRAPSAQRVEALLELGEAQLAAEEYRDAGRTFEDAGELAEEDEANVPETLAARAHAGREKARAAR